eukprot:2503888-Rhodomonas_salina.1
MSTFLVRGPRSRPSLRVTGGETGPGGVTVAGEQVWCGVRVWSWVHSILALTRSWRGAAVWWRVVQGERSGARSGRGGGLSPGVARGASDRTRCGAGQE